MIPSNFWLEGWIQIFIILQETSCGIKTEAAQDLTLCTILMLTEARSQTLCYHFALMKFSPKYTIWCHFSHQVHLL